MANRNGLVQIAGGLQEIPTGDSLSGSALRASGLGSLASGRFIGVTTAGSPTGGPYTVGDFVVDQTGAMYVCTSAGSPGSWVNPGTGAWLGMAATITTPAAAGALTANSATYNRVTKGNVPNATKIGIIVGVQSGNIMVGVYRNSGSGPSSLPSAQVAATSSVACPAPGYQELALGGSYSIGEGDWLALAVDNATASFARVAANGINNSPWVVRSSTFTLPAPTTAATQSNQMISMFAVP
jgi:hypothetical protein